VGTDEIDCVITDSQADPDEIDRLREAGVEVIVAGAESAEGAAAD
jgi:DeoR/GlpR family transcriptional regulator of sugar metabolism